MVVSNGHPFGFMSRQLLFATTIKVPTIELSSQNEHTNASSAILSDYFLSEDSPVRPCFAVIPTKPYEQMVEVAPELVMASYRRRCASFGVQM